MIPARKVSWFNRWFVGVIRRRLESRFQFVHVHGRVRLEALADKPVLVVSNHTSWWDPLVAVWVTSHVIRTNAYALMNGANLRRLPFFRLLGAFGVDLDRAGDGARGIRYAARLLRSPRTWVWVYAQGDERPVTERPLNFKPGAAAIARLAPRAQVLPLALRYEFGNTERPELHIRVGDVLASTGDVERDRLAQEEAVTSLLNAIDTDLRAGFRPSEHELFHRFKSGWWQRFAEWWLVQLTRGDVPKP